MAQYKFIAKSPSDPNGTAGGLGFNCLDSANRHVDRMNELLTDYGSCSLWNEEFWKIKPEPWIVEEK